MPTGNPIIKIDGYEVRVLPIGSVFVPKSEATMWEEVTAYHAVDGSRLINVDNALSALEDRDDLDEAEKKLLSLLQAAEKQGFEDIIINVS